ncbi:Solute carrier 26 [Quaeritorhiza haematococci]|nr:Solute carrier 26 [Quaeritorhiza haematococci]
MPQYRKNAAIAPRSARNGGDMTDWEDDMDPWLTHTLPPKGSQSAPVKNYEYYKQQFRTRLRYYVPVFGWFPKYNIGTDLRYDFIAGITVATLLVPQGLSFAQALVKLPPVYDVLGVSATDVNRQMSVGPEALISILTGATIANLNKHGGPAAPPTEEFSHHSTEVPPSPANPGPPSPDRMMESIATANLLALMVGLFTFLLGFFRLGFLDSVLSRALLRGFVTAVVVVVVIDLADSLLGIHNSNQSEAEMAPIEKLMSTLMNIHQTHVLTAIISFSSIAFLLAWRTTKGKLVKRFPWVQFIPEILALVVLSTLMSSIFRWDLNGVALLEDVKGGLIKPSIPTISPAKINSILLSALLISVIGFVESVAVAKTYAAKHNYSVSPNRELVALGVANIAGSFCGAWPAFGSLGRSAVNDAAGARTQLAGLITGTFVLLTITIFLPLFYFLPKAVCSSIIVVAALKLIEVHDFEFIVKLRAWNDLGLLCLTFFTTIFISIEAGTLISVGVSLLLVVKHTTKTRIAVLGRTLVVDPRTGALKSKFRSIHEAQRVERIEGSLIIRFEEGLFFGNTGQLKDRLKRVELYGELNVHPGEEPRRRATSTNVGLDGSSSVSGSTGSLMKKSPSLTKLFTSVQGQQQTPDQKTPGVGPTSNVQSTPTSSTSSLAVSPSRLAASGSLPTATERTSSNIHSAHPLAPINTTPTTITSSFASPSSILPPLARQSSNHQEHPIDSIIFDVEAMSGIDASATQTLLEIVQSYRSRNIDVCFVKLRDACLPMFVRSGLYELVGEERFFRKIDQAIEFLRMRRHMSWGNVVAETSGGVGYPGGVAEETGSEGDMGAALIREPGRDWGREGEDAEEGLESGDEDLKGGVEDLEDERGIEDIREGPEGQAGEEGKRRARGKGARRRLSIGNSKVSSQKSSGKSPVEGEHSSRDVDDGPHVVIVGRNVGDNANAAAPSTGRRLSKSESHHHSRGKGMASSPPQHSTSPGGGSGSHSNAVVIDVGDENDSAQDGDREDDDDVVRGIGVSPRAAGKQKKHKRRRSSVVRRSVEIGGGRGGGPGGPEIVTDHVLDVHHSTSLGGSATSAVVANRTAVSASSTSAVTPSAASSTQSTTIQSRFLHVPPNPRRKSAKQRQRHQRDDDVVDLFSDSEYEDLNGQKQQHTPSTSPSHPSSGTGGGPSSSSHHHVSVNRTHGGRTFFSTPTTPTMTLQATDEGDEGDDNSGEMEEDETTITLSDSNSSGVPVAGGAAHGKRVGKGKGKVKGKSVKKKAASSPNVFASLWKMGGGGKKG